MWLNDIKVAEELTRLFLCMSSEQYSAEDKKSYQTVDTV